MNSYCIRALIQVQPELIAARILGGKHGTDLRAFQNEDGMDSDVGLIL